MARNMKKLIMYYVKALLFSLGLIGFGIFVTLFFSMLESDAQREDCENYQDYGFITGYETTDWTELLGTCYVYMEEGYKIPLKEFDINAVVKPLKN